MNKVISTILWIFVILSCVQFIFMDRRIKKIEKMIQESLDNQPIEIKMEGSWKDFGKLTFSDQVWSNKN